MLALATDHYASRKGLNRPFARATAPRDRRLGQKLSMGLTPAQVARLEGMASNEVETLVAEPDFKALVDGYRALHAMSEEEQRRILTQLARHLLMEATALGDVRVATFVILQERMGKDPARTLARPPPHPRRPGHIPSVALTLEDAPFYARSVLRTHLLGEPATAMHESLSLDRFRSPLVQPMLPFRMPRAWG